MSSKTNEEKHRILRERLAQIKDKHNIKKEAKKDDAEIREYKENTNNINSENNKIAEKSHSAKAIKKVLLLFIISAGIYYGYTKLELSSIINISESKEIKTNQVANQKQITIKYNLNLKDASHIIILAEFKEEAAAKAMVNDKNVKGYNTNYFFLPEKSNSNNEVYSVYVGPYYCIEEANQWSASLKEEDHKIITL